MNIFYCNEDPFQCAKEHNDKHCVKMDIEYPQMLSTAHRVLDGTEYYGQTKNGRKIRRWRHPDPIMERCLYKASHINHPSAAWVRESTEHYNWLFQLWKALCEEYTWRYGKIHLCWTKLAVALASPPKNMDDKPFVEPPPAMSHFPQCIVEGDSIESYKNYYREAKASFSKWTKRPVPEWWTV